MAQAAFTQSSAAIVPIVVISGRELRDELK